MRIVNDGTTIAALEVSTLITDAKRYYLCERGAGFRGQLDWVFENDPWEDEECEDFV